MIRSQKPKFRELSGVDMVGLLQEWPYTQRRKPRGKLFSVNQLRINVQHAVTQA
jgi:hypothetical protein